MSDAYRNIRKTQLFEEQIERLMGSVRRADEFIEAAEWVLSRNPYEGAQVGPLASVWFLPMTAIPDQPLIVLYYAFDDEYVWFLCIEMF